MKKYYQKLKQKFLNFLYEVAVKFVESRAEIHEQEKIEQRIEKFEKQTESQTDSIIETLDVDEKLNRAGFGGQRKKFAKEFVEKFKQKHNLNDKNSSVSHRYFFKDCEGENKLFLEARATKYLFNFFGTSWIQEPAEKRNTFKVDVEKFSVPEYPKVVQG